MSVVTNAILCFGAGYDGVEIVSKVNQFFDDPRFGFVHVEDPKMPAHWWGGSKMLESEIAIGAFNCLDLDNLIIYLRDMVWEWPREAQLLVKGEDDDVFRSIYVGGWEPA